MNDLPLSSGIASRATWVRGLQAIAQFSLNSDRAWGVAQTWDGIIPSHLPSWLFQPLEQVNQLCVCIGVVATASQLNRQLSGSIFKSLKDTIDEGLLDLLLTKYDQTKGVAVPQWKHRPDRVLRGLGSELLLRHAKLEPNLHWQIARAFPPSTLATDLTPQSLMRIVGAGSQEFYSYQQSTSPVQ